MGKQTVACAQNRKLLCDDKEQTISTSAPWVHLECLAEKKEADLKGYILYSSINTTFWKR